MPFWFEPLALFEQYRGGFGVDLDQWHWCEWARIKRAATALSQDKENFKSIDRDTVESAPVNETKKNKRAQILEQTKKADLK